MELRKRRAARAERRARERDDLQRKKDEDEKMQRTLKELEEQRQVLALHNTLPLASPVMRHWGTCLPLQLSTV